MTVLPTVRRQLEQAAHRQATTRRRRFPAWRATVAFSTRAPTAHRRQRLRRERVVLGLSVVLTVAIAALAIALLGHRRAGPPPLPAAGLASRYGLDGDGIGTIRFGQKPATVSLGSRVCLEHRRARAPGRGPRPCCAASVALTTSSTGWDGQNGTRACTAPTPSG